MRVALTPFLPCPSGFPFLIAIPTLTVNILRFFTSAFDALDTRTPFITALRRIPLGEFSIFICTIMITGILVTIVSN